MVIFSKVRLGVSPDINALATIMVLLVTIGVDHRRHPRWRGRRSAAARHADGRRARSLQMSSHDPLQTPARRHDDLHGDDATARASSARSTWRRAFPTTTRRRKLKDLVAYHVAAGHNQYAPMIGVAAAARADRAQARRELRPAARQRERDHDHARRDRGDLLGRPGARASGRRGDPVRSLVRLLRARRAARGRAPDARAARSRRASRSTGSACAQSLSAAHAPGDAQHAAQSDRDRSPAHRISTCSPTCCGRRRRWCSSDEVYEHMVFDGERHASIVGHPELYERGVAVFSFGKTMHATGWRVGYTVAPPEITREIRRVHQFNTFSIAAPLQLAIADFLQGLARAQLAAQRVLPAQARPIPRLPAQLQLQLDAGGRHLLPAARLQRGLAAERRRVRRHVAARGGRGIDSGLAVLRERRRSSACCASASPRTTRRSRKRPKRLAGV